MKPSWYLPLIVVWAFLSIELAFHVNIWIHWPAANPVALNTFNNRLALAVMLLAVRALAVSEGGGKLDFFLWVPFGAPLFMAMMPDERLWYAVVSGAYPERINYSAGHWLYALVFFFLPVVLVDRRISRTTD